MKKVKILNNENGVIKFIFVTGLLAFLVYAGIKFGMPFYRYSAFKSDAKELARISTGDTEKTKAQIFERAMELKIPLKEEDIVVTKTERRVIVRTSWSEIVDIVGVYQKKLDFSINVEE
ncbi:MAG: hypothetical protein AB1480_17240 [Nitrospirota bacterium]